MISGQRFWFFTLFMMISLQMAASLDSKLQLRALQQSSKCYGVIIEAASTGTKVWIYRWYCRFNDGQKHPEFLDTSYRPLYRKYKIPLHTFGNNIDGLQNYFAEMIIFIKTNVPEYYMAETPIILRATGGMRSLDPLIQTNIISKAREIFLAEPFLYRDDSFKVITGAEEGMYGWITLNYLLGKLKEGETVGIIDIGSFSTQIAFDPKTKIEKYEEQLDLWEDKSYSIYSYSHFGYGLDASRLSAIKMSPFSKGENKYWAGKIYENAYYFPCFHTEYAEELDPTTIIIGTGIPTECSSLIKKMMKYDEPCEKKDCSFEGVYQNKLPANDFYGFSGLYYTTSFYDLTPKFTASQLEILSNNYCKLSWSEIQAVPKYQGNSFSNVYCYQGLFVSELIKAFGFDADREINSVDKIEESSITWTLGAMYYELYRECKLYNTKYCFQIKSAEYSSNIVTYSGSVFFISMLGLVGYFKFYKKKQIANELTEENNE